ncbi:MAG: hypothetical protein NVS3B20_24750 [Polyangiales bacterium]
MDMRTARSALGAFASVVALVSASRIALADDITAGATPTLIAGEDSIQPIGMLHSDGDEFRVRHTYTFLASLPVVESLSLKQYDLRPIVGVVIGRKMQLTDSIAVTFVRGRNLLVADVGKGSTLGVAPNGFGLAQGGLFTFSSNF